MELIKINDEKLKVMLSKIDMQCYDLDCEKIDYDCQSTKAAFRKILSYAKEQTGFDTGDDKIFVQIYPARCGGCEMYVTRLSQDGERVHSISAVYRFDELDNLLRACRMLNEYGFQDRSELYSDNSAYYLAISEDYKQNNNTYSVNERGKGFPHYPLLNEFGRRLRADRILPYVREHCHTILESEAIERLSKIT